MLKSRLFRILLSVCLMVALFALAMAGNLRLNADLLEANIGLSDALEHDDLLQIRRQVAAGADPNTRADYTPRLESFLDRLKRLVARAPAPANGVGETPLIVAAEHGDLNLMRFLLAHGASPNTAAQPGYTALHLAAGMDDSYESVSNLRPLTGAASYQASKLLIDAGADPNVGNPYDGTPLRYAIAQKDQRIVRLFLDRGAKWNYADRFTLTCFWDAVEDERVWLVRKWLAEGANPNEQESRHGQNVLTRAVSRGNIEIARLLLDAGANPNIQDDGQMMGSPLIEAVRNGKSLEMIQLLLKRGARPDMPAGRVMVLATPLQWAEKRGDQKILKALREGCSDRRPPIHR